MAARRIGFDDAKQSRRDAKISIRVLSVRIVPGERAGLPDKRRVQIVETEQGEFLHEHEGTQYDWGLAVGDEREVGVYERGGRKWLKSPPEHKPFSVLLTICLVMFFAGMAFERWTLAQIFSWIGNAILVFL